LTPLVEQDDDEAGCAAPVVLISLRMWIHDKKWHEDGGCH